MKDNDLYTEVSQRIREIIDGGDIANPLWVTQAVVASHDGIEGPDADWYTRRAYERVRDVVRDCVSKYKVKPTVEQDPQLLLGPQFEHLQVAYAVIREEEPLVVPTALMTPDELEAKAYELERMGDGCYKHADELRRYIRVSAA